MGLWGVERKTKGPQTTGALAHAHSGLAFPEIATASLYAPTALFTPTSLTLRCTPYGRSVETWVYTFQN